MEKIDILIIGAGVIGLAIAKELGGRGKEVVKNRAAYFSNYRSLFSEDRYSGGVRLGPDDEYLPTNVKDYSTRESSRADFYASVREFMPFLEENDLFADTTGIRPKLQGPEGDFRDFVIREESDTGFPNFINLIGIESPGLTASCAITSLVGALV